MEAFMTTKGADFISRQQYAVSVTVAVCDVTHLNFVFNLT